MRFWGSDKISEEDLITGCIGGDHKMQEELYKAFAPRMFVICLRYASSYPEAEDMMQEGFIRAFGNLSKFRNEGSFEGWMKRIFINTAIEGYRKNHSSNGTLEVEEMKNDLVQKDDFHYLSAADLLKMVQSLSPGYRTVFNLYAIEGYSHQEIADMLGINIGTSKSQLARARYLLQKMVLNSQKVQRYAAVF
ncbi:MAG TPA: sigma-70 family RNA polymerase sigma factor [Chitinophagales bacterium]|nr:sigma-70 family RNA polymerase sigma factor [Chitinophagales bacterium]